MGMGYRELRCVTYKFSDLTRARIEAIKRDRMAQEHSLFGFVTPISNTDVLRFLIDQETVNIERRAAAAAALDQEKQRKQAKVDRQRQRRQAQKGGSR